QFVSDCGYSFCRAEFATHSSEELPEIIVRVMERMCTHPERIRDSVFDWPCFGVQNFSATDLFFWTQSKPRCKCRRVAEARNIGPDLTDDRVSGDSVNTRNVGQIDSHNAIQFSTKIKSRVIVLLLVNPGFPQKINSASCVSIFLHAAIFSSRYS